MKTAVVAFIACVCSTQAQLLSEYTVTGTNYVQVNQPVPSKPPAELRDAPQYVVLQEAVVEIREVVEYRNGKPIRKPHPVYVTQGIRNRSIRVRR